MTKTFLANSNLTNKTKKENIRSKQLKQQRNEKRYKNQKQICRGVRYISKEGSVYLIPYQQFLTGRPLKK